jgi:AbiTii-like protein
LTSRTWAAVSLFASSTRPCPKFLLLKGRETILGNHWLSTYLSPLEKTGPVMLLDDIIAELGNKNSSLTDALLKTKIFLHQINKKELVQWVNNELNGYPDDADLPPYRILPSQVLANVSNITWRTESQPIPIQHLDDDYVDSLVNAKFRQSLAIIEQNASGKGKFILRIPMEANHLFDKGLANDFRTENVWCETSRMDILNILVQVRSRLLDFLLELKDSIGEPMTEAEMRAKSASVDTQSMFNNAIFGSGSNTTILIGHQSSITATQTITGSQLAERVRKLVEQVEPLLPNLPASIHGDSEGALAELREAAETATPDVSRLRRGLESLKHVMEHATGHVVATGVLALIGELLSRAAH